MIFERGMSFKELWSLYAASDCFFLTSKAEGLGMPILEAMSVGLPVIASNFPLWKEIIVDNDCGLCVNPESPEEIAKAIQFFFDNPDEVKRMGENGKKAVNETYNWQIEEKKLIKIFSDFFDEYIRSTGSTVTQKLQSIIDEWLLKQSIQD